MKKKGKSTPAAPTLKALAIPPPRRRRSQRRRRPQLPHTKGPRHTRTPLGQVARAPHARSSPDAIANDAPDPGAPPSPDAAANDASSCLHRWSYVRGCLGQIQARLPRSGGEGPTAAVTEPRGRTTFCFSGATEEVWLCLSSAEFVVDAYVLLPKKLAHAQMILEAPKEEKVSLEILRECLSDGFGCNIDIEILVMSDLRNTQKVVAQEDHHSLKVRVSRVREDSINPIKKE